MGIVSVGGGYVDSDGSLVVILGGCLDVVFSVGFRI